ncbi:hypothetical protein ABEB36_004757 [Hypothenemus hampei]|uniref:Uncharacterized protein n=1 Tax=Hypothenemus hampei TaxID=57062 RepID=A0ABD1EVU6_HYPHA
MGSSILNPTSEREVTVACGRARVPQEGSYTVGCAWCPTDQPIKVSPPVPGTPNFPQLRLARVVEGCPEITVSSSADWRSIRRQLGRLGFAIARTRFLRLAPAGRKRDCPEDGQPSDTLIASEPEEWTPEDLGGRGEPSCRERRKKKPALERRMNLRASNS